MISLLTSVIVLFLEKVQTVLLLPLLQLADTLDISQQLIAAYESGQRRIPAFVLLKLSQLFDISIEELYGTKSKPVKRGPASTLHRQIEQIRQLPKSKQKFVMEMLDTVIRQQSS